MSGWLRRVVALVPVVLLGALAPVVAAEPPVALYVHEPDRVAYPLLSADDRTHRIEYRQTRDANLTVTVRDGAGDLVRTLLDRVSRVSGTTEVVWDLEDAAGRPVPDGIYTVDLEAVDSGGSTAHADVLAGVDRRTPPALSGLVPGSVVSGVVHPRLTALGDLGVTEVVYEARPASTPAMTCARDERSSADTGFVGDLDLRGCPSGKVVVGAVLWWTDPLGARNVGSSAPTTVVVADSTAPVIKPPATGRQSLVDRSTYTSPARDFTITEPSPLSRVGYWVVNSAGTTIRRERTLVVERRDPVTLVGSLRWNGTNDAGTLQPSGTYQIRIRAVDSSGNTRTATSTVQLDGRIPGVLSVAPVAGEPNHYRVSTKVATGVSVYALRVNFGRWTALAQQQGTSTTWATVVDVSDVPAGTTPVSADITWHTPDASSGGQYRTNSVSVAVADSTPPRVVSPAARTLRLVDPGTYQWDQLDYEVSDASGSSCRYWITDAAGRTVVAERAFESCEPGSAAIRWKGRDDAGVLLPTGAYTVHSRFRDPLGHVTAGTDVVVTLDATVPATVAAERDDENPDLFHVTVTPRPGVSLGEARIFGAPAERDPATGLWHLTVDLADDAQQAEISATVGWYPPSGGAAPHFETASVGITRLDTTPPVVTAPPPRTLGLSDPDTYDPEGMAFVIDEPYGITEASYRITDASGVVVVGERPFDLPPDTRAHLHWDGTDDAGTALPEGDYTVHARFANAAGFVVDDVRATFILDRTVPGALAPLPDEPLSGSTQFTYVPSTEPGVVIDAVWITFAASRDGPEFWNPSVDGSWRSTYDAGLLPPGPNSYLVVTSWHDAGGEHVYEAAPATVDVAVRPADLAAPALSATAGNQEVRLTWSPPVGRPTGYRVEWAPLGGSWRGTDLPPTARGHVVAGLRNGSRYQVRVRTRAADTPGTWSATLTRMPDAAPPAPRLVSAESRRRAAAVGWRPGTSTARQGVATSFVVQVRVAGTSTWRNVRVTGPTVTAVRVEDLRPGVRYLVRVVARNARGSQASVQVAVRPRR